MISIVSPVYKAERIVNELVRQISQSVSQITMNFEIILVEDGSPDDSWERIRENCVRDPRVRGFRLSRNFGQHYAINAGLSAARGEWVVVMDCDLQDQPSEIPRLLAKAQKGFDSVFAQRTDRSDTFFKKTVSRLFYALFSYLTETKQDPTIANFGIYRKCVIDAVLAMGDQILYFPTMAQWVGFRKAYLPVAHGDRHEGKSSYSLGRLVNLAINNILAFSDKPLRIVVRFGMTISIGSFLVGIGYLVGYLLGMLKVAGFASLIISTWLLSGLVIMFLGVNGLYLGKIFETLKRRPRYIVQETIN